MFQIALLSVFIPRTAGEYEQVQAYFYFPVIPNALALLANSIQKHADLGSNESPERGRAEWRNACLGFHGELLKQSMEIQKILTSSHPNSQNFK